MSAQIMRKLLFLTAFSLAGGQALAQSATPGATPGAAPADPPHGTAQAARPGGGIAPVERRIAGLQRRLKITPAQQPQWDAFTAVMRQNAEHMASLQHDRADKVTTMTAPEDMQSYAELARTHADDVQRLVPAFNDLYASMTPEQKALADRTFHEFQGPASHTRSRPS